MGRRNTNSRWREGNGRGNTQKQRLHCLSFSPLLCAAEDAASMSHGRTIDSFLRGAGAAAAAAGFATGAAGFCGTTTITGGGGAAAVCLALSLLLPDAADPAPFPLPLLDSRLREDLGATAVCSFSALSAFAGLASSCLLSTAGGAACTGTLSEALFSCVLRGGSSFLDGSTTSARVSTSGVFFSASKT